jgi:hypothetical protein
MIQDINPHSRNNAIKPDKNAKPDLRSINRGMAKAA